jgi:hypothetical protein
MSTFKELYPLIFIWFLVHRLVESLVNFYNFWFLVHRLVESLVNFYNFAEL